MRLLVTTQVVDQNDPLLGFFHHWIEELAKRVDSIEVICLREGKYAFPANVRVYSLGKVDNEPSGVGSRILYAMRFRHLVRELARHYDTVLVHMNPEYVILAGGFWKRHHKKIALWYNHPQGGFRLNRAARLADKLLYTSPYAASAKFPHAVQMPVGIDTDLFAPRAALHDRHQLYMQGRVMPSKRVHIALEALRTVRADIPVILTLVGPEDTAYGVELRKDFADLISVGAVDFMGPRKNEDTPVLYSVAGAALNLAPSGHFDKTVLEPMACETPVIVGSEGIEVVPPEWRVAQDDPGALAEAIKRLITLPEEEYRALGASERASVVREHSLAALMTRLTAEMQNIL